MILGACGDKAPSSTSVAASGGEVLVQQEGDILLEPSGTAGPGSFTDDVNVVRGPTTTFSMPATTPSTAQSQTTLAPGQVAAWPGGTPGLYGGSRSKTICDKEAQVTFLEQNPDKAAAFCVALNSDPTLRWSGGNQVRPDQLRDYFAELTPLLLTRDTRVTNHGFNSGRPTPRQSVLQAGQYVLVDQYGVPRVRCECGNPLIPPKPVASTPNYTGPPWEGFDPTQVVIIQQTTVIIQIFVIVDVDTGQIIDRPAGTTGDQDVPHEADTTTTSASTTTTSVATTSSETTIPEHPDINGLWEGTFTFTAIDVDPELQRELEAQGCSAAEIEAALGVPLPMTIDITVDAQGKGTAVVLIDTSPIAPEGGSSEPQTMAVTYVGDTLIFEPDLQEGESGEMTGKVLSRGGRLVIKGTQSSSAEGYSTSAVWEVTRS